MSLKLSESNRRCNLPASQAGAGLPIALFIVTVLSLIVIGMSQLQESSGNAISLQIQSQRAFFAAESGAQVILARILPGTDTAEDVWEKVKTIWSINEEKVTLQLPVTFDGNGLKSCTANVKAELILDEDDQAALINVVSTGSCGAEDSADRAQRTVEVRVR